MPAQPQWLLRIPAIVEELAALGTPVVDRAIVEKTFRVKRRRAIHLMGAFGGYQVGRTFVVGRERLIERLRRIAAGERFDFEKQRHERLARSLEEVRRHSQAARVKIAPHPREPAVELPAGVVFGRGRLTVEFAGVEELLAKLYGIAQAAAADFRAFQALAMEPDILEG